MSNHAEALAGAPDRTAADALTAWRASATPATWRPVRKIFEDAGIDLRLLCYNMNVRTTTGRRDRVRLHDGEGARRQGDHDVDAGQHGQARRAVRRQAQDAGRVPRPRQPTDPDEVATPESFAAVMAVFEVPRDQPRHRPLTPRPASIRSRSSSSNHARITNLHLKDKKKATNGGGNVAVGAGRHADQGRAEAAAEEQVGHSGEHRVRVPGRSAGRDPEVPPVLQGRARIGLRSRRAPL